MNTITNKKKEKLKLKVTILLNILVVFYMVLGSVMTVAIGWKFMFLQAFLTSEVIWAAYFLLLKDREALNG